ncbi:MAG: eS25 family ribosomal protein [Candidatus Bathyarchaeia archaeon]
MGGVKKKSVSQMAKAQAVKESKDVKKDRPKEKTKVTDVSTRGLFIDMDGDRLVKEVSTMKVITPFEVSSRFKVKISVAKDILEELWRKGYIMPVSGSNRMRVFKFIGG